MILVKTVTKVEFNWDPPPEEKEGGIYYSSCMLGPGIVCLVIHEDDNGVVAQPIDYPHMNAYLNRGRFDYTTPLHILAEAASE